MKISVILCTYNRCQSLANALESVAASNLPDSVEWEVLVVDNNSSDRTREVIEDFCARYPGRFRYWHEPRPGKSHALNSGIKAADGDVTAFMDDDVVVDSYWLHNLTAALRDDEYVGVGGRILPPRTFSPPNWLSTEGPHSLGGNLAFFDCGPQAGDLTEPPYGTNMAFKKTVFEKYGYFRTDLGPRPNSEIRNEDTEFGRRILTGGDRMRYEPSAVVYHTVPENRCKKQYFLRWWYDYGRAEIREKGKRPPIWGIPRHYIRIPNLILNYLSEDVKRWMVALNPKERFFWKTRVWMRFGQIAEIWRDAQEAKKKTDDALLDG